MALFLSLIAIVIGGNAANEKGATHPTPSHFEQQIRK